jgi:ankyrin repeat protein
MSATIEGKFHAVQMLLHAGADVNIGDKDGFTPIHGAGFQGRADIARLLVRQGGMNVNDRHDDGYTPMHRAIWGQEPRHAETVKVLLQLGANLKAKTPRGEVHISAPSS